MPHSSTPLSNGYYLNASTTNEAGSEVAQILYYLDEHQPIYYEFPLPAGNYTVELLDPWAMSITRVEGTVSGKAKVKLPVRPFHPVRFRRVG